MLRLRIEFDLNRPFLRVASGILYAEEVDSVNVSKPAILLFKCRIKKEEGSLGYSSFEKDEGIPSTLFDCIKPIADQMIRSYWKGMVLDDRDYVWVPMSGDDSWGHLTNLRDEIKSYIIKENL
jgi:hypothetical protein